MLDHSCTVHTGRPALGTKNGTGFRWTSYGELRKLVEHCRGGLAALGVGPGDCVAIVANNSVEWAVAAYATYGLGATVIPMYEAQKPADWAFILRDSGAKVAILGSPAIRDRLRPRELGIPSFERAVTIGETGDGTFERLLETGARSPVQGRPPSAETIATIIYTSGTTGTPKGVKLSHGNIMSNIDAVHEIFDFTENDRSLSFIPWAHAFGHTCELHTLLSLGASIGINDALAHLPDNLLAVQPTVLIAVPKVFNGIFAHIHAEISRQPAIVRRVFEAAVRGALDERPRFSERLARVVAERLLFPKIRERFGGKLKYAVSGGATLSKEVAELIQTLGIVVYEGYGLTETSPMVTTNTPGHVKLGSVGRVIPGVTVKLERNPAFGGAEGEIVVFGPNVMQGYHNRPEEQAAAFTPEGGFRTGDIGTFDDDGFLHITGRIKEQYKLENGKYVAPSRVEEELRLSPYIANVMVQGANKPYNVAVVALDVEAVSRWAKERGYSIEHPTEDQRVLELIKREFTERTANLSEFERPRRFALATEDFTVENDLLTPTLKVKRARVFARYGQALEALYRQAPTAQ